MFENYFKTAWRNLVRNKTFSFINIFGLALGLACSLLIFLWVRDELSKDASNTSKNIFVVYERMFSGGKIEAGYYSPGLLATELKRVEPEIQYASGFWPMAPSLFEAGVKRLKMTGAYAGEDFFRIFSYPLLAGDRKTALSDPALTKENVFMNGKITVEEAFSLLSDDLKSRMPGLDNALTENKITDIDDGVKGVFMDFIYNTGSATRVIGIFKKYGASGLYEEIKTGKIKSVNQSRKVMRLNLLRKAKMTDDFYKAVDDPMRINPTKNDLNVAYRFIKLNLRGNVNRNGKIEVLIIII